MRIAYILFFVLNLALAQDAVHNYGTIKIHDDGLVGFHMDLINDGAFNQNSGLVGFYNSNKELTLSGNSNPIFYDAEVAVDDGFYIENTMGVTNNLNLISGIIYTPRTQSEINLSFLNDSFYVGESNNTLIDGYASIQGKETFTFPIGENNILRPLTIASESANDYAKSAYYRESPNSPSIFGTSFNTEQTANEYIAVSDYEFWHLEGELPSKVTLTWNEESYVSLLGDFISDLKVVGWNIENKEWENLGNTDVQGDMDNGSITSDTFIPNDYEIITIGGNNDILETLSSVQLDNYYMTPNGDGINDRLVIDAVASSPNNSLQIFNRYGILVYSKENYNNEFNGISNRESAIAKNSGLASGIYFYVITLNDLNIRHQGYLYLTTYQKN